MRPHYEQKNASTGLMDRVEWPAHVANDKLREIRAKVVAELRASDEKVIAEVRGRNPDPIYLNGLRHCAAETIDETNERWWKFCSTPQPLPASATTLPRPKKINKKHPMTQMLTEAGQPNGEIRESSRFPESDEGKPRRRI